MALIKIGSEDVDGANLVNDVITRESSSGVVDDTNHSVSGNVSNSLQLPEIVDSFAELVTNLEVASADSKCNAKSGTCQETNSASCGGVYERGLCSGSSTRVCCVPISGGGCTAEQKRLACQLRDSSRVVAFATHVSQISDNATPDNNLNDMCTGGRASRSSYKSTCSCSAPGGSICLHEKLLRYLVALQSSGKVTINELAGGCHSCKSFHYAGFAVDLNRRDGRTPEYTTKCEQMGGTPFNEGTHLHCQF